MWIGNAVESFREMEGHRVRRLDQLKNKKKNTMGKTERAASVCLNLNDGTFEQGTLSLSDPVGLLCRRPVKLGSSKTTLVMFTCRIEATIKHITDKQQKKVLSH